MAMDFIINRHSTVGRRIIGAAHGALATWYAHRYINYEFSRSPPPPVSPNFKITLWRDGTF